MTAIGIFTSSLEILVSFGLNSCAYPYRIARWRPIMNKQIYTWLLKSIVGLLSVYFLNRCYNRWKKHVSHQSYIKEHGCELARRMPEREPFGLGLFLDEINHFKSHTSLENYGHRFRQLDTTTFFGRFLWFVTFRAQGMVQVCSLS